MRLFWAALVILTIFALDRAYMDGQNAEIALSLARQGARAINDVASDFVRLVLR